jgi:DNA-binding SARP family transcriptional activator
MAFGGHGTRVRLQLIGDFRLRLGDDDVPVPQAAQRVIAFVALQERPVCRGRLAGSLWLDKAEERASANLRSALWRLRRQGADVLYLTERAARLRPEVEVDVHDATAWAWRVIEGRARPDDLDRHPPLAELLADWYDDWVLMERERLRQRCLHALEAQSRALLDAGRTARAIDLALALVAAEPLRESAHRLVIDIHLAEGNVSEARHAREGYVVAMRDQLGIDVSDRLAEPVPAARPPRDGRDGRGERDGGRLVARLAAWPQPT